MEGGVCVSHCVDPCGLSPRFFLNLFGFEWRRSGSDGTQISWQYIYPPLLPYFPTTSAFKRSSRSLKATHSVGPTPSPMGQQLYSCYGNIYIMTCLIFCSKYLLRMDKFVWRKQSKQTNTNDLSDLLLVLLVEPAWLWDYISWGTK